MEVTHIENKNTHAIIGGGKPINFGVQQDAEFFEIMSSTLYSDKKRAFIREVLCNAHDANIEAGKPNAPVLVTITDNQISFQDFGSGISTQELPQIYCTYGGSTKRKNKAVTGGFGLGTKAPFAYAKNFTVTSCHSGMKSVYNISRGTAATQGIPDLRLMVSVPTKETGLTVTVPILEEDKAELTLLVRQLAYYGGILIKLNKRTYKPLPYNQLAQDMNFILVPTNQTLPKWMNIKRQQPNFFVKVGAVIYPIPDSHTQIHFSMLGADLFCNDDYIIIFNAKPGTVGITPSRESLSMTDLTKMTLESLFNDFKLFVMNQKDTVLNNMVELYRPKIGTKRFLNSMSKESLRDLSLFFRHTSMAYEKFCSSMGYILYGSHTVSTITGPAGLQDYLMHELLSNRKGSKEVAAILAKNDPDGALMRKIVTTAIKQAHPYDYKQTLKFLRAKVPYYTITNIRQYLLTEKLVRFMRKFVRLDSVQVVTNSSRYSNRQLTYQSWADSIKPMKITSRRSRGSNLTQNLSDFWEKNHDKLGKDFRNLRVILTQSEAALQRVKKSHSDSNFFSQPMIIIYAKRKKDYLASREMLESMKMLDVTYASDPIYLPTPVKLSQQFLVFNMAPDGTYTTIPFKDQPVKFFIYNPVNYNSITGEYIVKRSQVSKTLLTVLSGLYPDLLMVSSVVEAKSLEAQGYTNVFADVAKQSKIFFDVPMNYMKIINNISSIAQYGMHYLFSRLVNIVTLPALMEAFDILPDYVDIDVPAPPVVELYLNIIKARLAPKHGVQYLHQLADVSSEQFRQKFSGELNAVLSDPMLHAYLAVMPSHHSNLTNETRVVLQAATVAAIQSVRLHRKLGNPK